MTTNTAFFVDKDGEVLPATGMTAAQAAAVLAGGGAGPSGTVTHTGGPLTAHGVVVGAGGNDAKVIAPGTAGQVLTSQGPGADPVMADPAGGGGGSSTFAGLSDKTTADIPGTNTPTAVALAAKQALLVSGTNIKTINGSSIVGAGNLVVGGGGSGIDATDTGYDVVIVIGQSNALGVNSAPDEFGYDPADPRIWRWVAGANGDTGLGPYKALISLAHEPLGHPGTSNVGPGLTYARYLAGSLPTNRRVLLVPAAITNTGLSVSPFTWASPSGAGFTQAVGLANAAIAAAGPNCRVAAILWVQGEFEIFNGGVGATYKTALVAMIAGLRAAITGAATAKFVIGSMVPSYALVLVPGTPFDDAQQQVASEGTNIFYARGPDGDGVIHYTAPQARDLGYRMFKAVYMQGVPAQVTGLGLSAADVSINASWTTPAAAPVITNYLVEYKASSSGTWLTFAHSASTTPSITITGLSVTTSYDVRISAINAIGTGPVSAVSTVSTTAGPAVPAQVTGLTLTPSATSMGAAWTAPASFPALSNYLVEYKLSSSGTWLTFAHAASTATSISITGLTSGQSYDVRISGINAVGTGTASATSTASTTSSSRTDNFNRSNGAIGTPSDGGSAWVAQLGAWGVLANQAYHSDITAGTFPTCVLDAGTPNVTVQVTLSLFAAYGFGICFRALDASNYLFVQCNAGATQTDIYKNVAGTLGLLATVNTTAWANGDVLNVTVDGANLITVFRNGTSVLSVTDATGSGRTKHGLWAVGDVNDMRFDNFSIT